MKGGQSGLRSDREFAFVLETSLAHLTRMSSLAGFENNSNSLLGIAAGLGLARHFRFPVRTRS